MVWVWILLAPIAIGLAATAYLMGLHWLGRRLGWNVESPWLPVLCMTAAGVVAAMFLGPIG
ncbi:hypothetical protein [Arenimonas alkanexedens]